MKTIKTNKIILCFCIVEILLIIPRTISYILIDIFPVRIFSLPLVSFSLIVTITGYIFTEILANRKILKRLQIFRLTIFLWLIIIVWSTVMNPLRDVIFEAQGMIIFMMNIVTFAVVSVSLGVNRKRLIWVVFVSIASILLSVVYILAVNPSLLPVGYSQGGLRYEGLFSSTPIMALVSISTAFIFFYRNSIRIFGVAGIMIAFSGLVFAATRSTMVASVLAAFVVLHFALKSKNSISLIVSVLIVVPLVFLVIIRSVDLFPAVKSHLQYALLRIDSLSVGSYEGSRADEMFYEFELFLKSPLIGHGYGILNKFTLPNWGSPVFGHSFISSVPARTGILGVGILLWLGFHTAKRLSYAKDRATFELFAIAKGAMLGALFLITVSNFTGYQTFGIYGVLVGVAVGSNITIP